MPKPDEAGYSWKKKCGCVVTLLLHDKTARETIIKLDWKNCKVGPGIQGIAS